MKISAAKLPQNYRKTTILRHMDDCRKINAAKSPLKGGLFCGSFNFSASSFPTINAAK
jgi:hypothetical protein